MKALYQCLGVSFKIVGRELRANFVVLDSKGIDVILGMGWLSKVDAVIQCAKRSVLLTSPEGERFEFIATLPSVADCHKLGDLYKGLVVNPCHSPWKYLRALQTRASRETRLVGKVYNLCRVKN
jgi:hypothetical protein